VKRISVSSIKHSKVAKRASTDSKRVEGADYGKGGGGGSGEDEEQRSPTSLTTTSAPTKAEIKKKKVRPITGSGGHAAKVSLVRVETEEVVEEVCKNNSKWTHLY
jgi:hypothetical protein